MEIFMNIIKFLFCLFTAMVGYNLHRSLFWAIINFLFSPFSWIKWLICRQINLTFIKETIKFYFK